ncbi:ATP-binding protein [Dendrosporobacter sp. 1207_IL3150]|uniref:ATP-binding protein n=1 Tax=Dendrosporobacter sp. 1207_IL3150 TaxID=3084054 RepID=UPI002FDB3229
MTFFEMSLLATIAANFAVVCIYCYLYLQYRHLYLGLWILGWIMHFARLPFLANPLPDFSAINLLVYEIIAMISSVIMLIATSKFVDKKVNKLWYSWGIIVFLIIVIIQASRLPFVYSAIPVCLYIGALFCKNGLLHLYHLRINGLGKYITGIAYIILGLHTVDMPFLITITWFVPWGVLIDAVFRFLVAVGTLIVFFEKTRHDLIEKEQHYRLLTENALDVIYRYKISPHNHFDYVSPSVERLTGLTPNDLCRSPMKILRIIHPKDLNVLKRFMLNLPSAFDQPLTLRLITSSKSIIWIEQTAVPIFDSKGTCIGFEAVARDISSRKALEDDVSRLDRLKTIGQMAASLAHEIRNPLTTVQGYLQFFSNKQEFAKYNTQIGLLLDELNRTNLILSEYLSLSKNRKPELMPTQLNNIIEALYPLLKVDAKASDKNILLNIDAIPILHLDEKEIRQLILNLVRNGIEAMLTGGTMTISTYLQETSVVLAIKDDGPGIPKSILEKLGEPFLTTKETGTGLGLTICYTIASRNNAKISVDTGPSGTTFFTHFALPFNGKKSKS